MPPDSTIVALSTAPGVGAIAVIRISGSAALKIAHKLLKNKNPIKPRIAFHANIYDDDELLDDVIVLFFKNPSSYTGEDLVEISCHGGPYIINRILETCIKHGADIAQPGEFTKRAFINGKLDLSQAEAIADLVAAQTSLSHQAAISSLSGTIGREIDDLRDQIINLISILELELDFSENELELTTSQTIQNSLKSISKKTKQLYSSYSGGKILGQGALVPIVGPPNSGKSSLWNAFLKEERAIVTPFPGTTRDSLEETISIDGYLIRLLDTAGIRLTKNPIEKIGIDRAIAGLQKGDVVLFVIDPTKPIKSEWSKYYQHNNTIIVINKTDIAPPIKINRLIKHFKNIPTVTTSAKNHTGIHELSEKIIDILSQKTVAAENIIITSQRQAILLRNALRNLDTARQNINKDMPTEIIIADLRQALNNFDNLLGKITTEEILNNIFQNFCIGK
jgi:tRNA modification GTPase